LFAKEALAQQSYFGFGTPEKTPGSGGTKDQAWFAIVLRQERHGKETRPRPAIDLDEFGAPAFGDITTKAAIALRARSLAALDGDGRSLV